MARDRYRERHPHSFINDGSGISTWERGRGRDRQTETERQRQREERDRDRDISLY